MDDQSPPPDKPVIPPPDIPKPTIPPPDIKAPEPAPVVSPAPAIVNVRTRDAGDTAEEETGAGSLASFNSRLVAALIDVVVTFGLQIAALWILPGFAEKLAWLLGIAYFVTRDSLPFLGGQSVGKRAMKLKVSTLDDHPIIGKWETALIRNGVLIIPFFGLIEVFVLLTREDKPERGRRLGDEWAKTKVVIAPDPPQDAEKQA